MKIAYCMSRYALLSETAIIREMTEIEKEGFEIEVFPLIKQMPEVVNDEVKAFLPFVHHRRPLHPHVFLSNLVWACKAPGKYFSSLRCVFRENHTDRKFLTHSLVAFWQAVDEADTMRKLGIDHMHAHFPTFSGVFAWTIWRLTGISYSVTVHAHDLYVRQEMLDTKLRDALFIRTISQFNKRFILEHCPSVKADKIYVIHCGIRPAQYRVGKRAPLNERLDAAEIGSLQPYKGLKYLIEAAAILRDQEVPFTMRLIGRGELREELAAQIEKLGLGEQVILMGAITDEEISDTLADSNCYIQPSIITETGKMEGIPASIMEAACADLPIIATDISGISELVIPDRGGLLVKEKDPAALAGALLAFHRDPAKAAAYAEFTRALVQDEFLLEKSCHALACLFRELI